MAIELHVTTGAPAGGNGTERRPFAGVEAARDEVRRLRASGSTDGPVTVLLHAGIHRLSRTLELTTEDGGTLEHPVVYRSAPGERAVVSGGEPVTGWSRQADGSATAAIEGDDRIRSFRVGDEEAVLARYPSFDPAHPRTGGWLFAQWWGKPWERGNLRTPVRGLRSAGDRLEWDVVVDLGGCYTVWVAVARPAGGQEDPDVRVSVAAGDGVASAFLGHSGTEREYGYHRVGSLPLAVGPARISLTNVSGGELSLFHVLLVTDSDWDPASGVEVLQWWGDYRINHLPDDAELLVLQAEAYERSVGAHIQRPRSEPPGKTDRIVTAPGDLPSWRRWDLVDVHIFPAWGWVNAIVPVRASDAASAMLRVDCAHDIRPGNRFFLAGTPEAMTDPGEFYHDPVARTIGYMPRRDELDDAPAIAARLKTLIHVTGSHIVFEDLTFSDTDYSVPGGGYSPDDAALVFSGIDGGGSCTVRGSRFEHIRGYAIRLEQRCRTMLIERNEMRRLGGGGVLLTGDDRTQPVENRIVANTIIGCGAVCKHVAAVSMGASSGNLVAHNLIRGTSRYAIAANSSTGRSSHNNVIEYNDIEDTNLETNDTGAIETLGRDRMHSGNVIRYNRVVNTVGLKTTQHGEFMSPHYTWGIYLDDFSSGTTIVGNIVDGTVLGGVNLHGGRDNTIENNILLNGSERQISFSPYFNDPNDRFMSGNVSRRNIIAGPASEFFIFGRQGRWYPEVLGECDYNVYWRTDGSDLEDPRADVTPLGSLAAWRGAGYDTHTRVADPLLTVDESGFPVPAPNSPAWELGFERIPVERIGPAGYDPAESRH